MICVSFWPCTHALRVRNTLQLDSRSDGRVTFRCGVRRGIDCAPQSELAQLVEPGEVWAYASSDYSYYYGRVRIQKLEGSTAVIRYLDADDVESKSYRKPTRNLRSL